MSDSLVSQCCTFNELLSVLCLHPSFRFGSYFAAVATATPGGGRFILYPCTLSPCCQAEHHVLSLNPI